MNCEENNCCGYLDVCTAFTLYFLNVFLKVEDEPNKVSDPDRTEIKRNIVNLMLTSPEQIQKQVHPHITVPFIGFNLKL